MLPPADDERGRPAPSAGTDRQRQALEAMEQFSVVPPDCISIQVLFEYQDRSQLAGRINRRNDAALPIACRLKLAWRHLCAAASLIKARSVPANGAADSQAAPPEAKHDGKRPTEHLANG